MAKTVRLYTAAIDYRHVGKITPRSIFSATR
jgi:hypothetical protein